MNKFIKPASILFYLLSFLVFVILGASFAGITGAADDQGLAAGAIVLGYGIISGFVAIVASIVLVSRVSHKFVIIANRILFLLFLVLIAMLFVRQKMRKKAKDNEMQTRVTTEIIHQAVYTEVENSLPQTGENPLGMGFSAPIFMNILFYIFMAVPTYRSHRKIIFAWTVLYLHKATREITVFLMHRHGYSPTT